MDETTGAPARQGDGAAETPRAEGLTISERAGQVALFQTPEEMIGFANALCVELGHETLLAVRRLKAGDFGDLPRAGAIVRDLLSVCKTVLDEGVKREKQRQQRDGVVHDYALDLERARAEISGRLARIAAAGGDQGASG